MSSLRQCEYEMLFSICPCLHSSFNFPTGLQLLFTQIAVQLISSHAVKILWVTKLNYMIHWPPFAGHICKYSRCNDLKREIFFWQKIFSAVILSGLGSRAQQSLIGLTMLVIADSEDIVSWTLGQVSCVLSVRFRSSYHRNVNCSNRVFCLLWIFNSQVSCLGWARWPRSNIDRSFARIVRP